MLGTTGFLMRPRGLQEFSGAFSSETWDGFKIDIVLMRIKEFGGKSYIRFKTTVSMPICNTQFCVEDDHYILATKLRSCEGRIYKHIEVLTQKVREGTFISSELDKPTLTLIKEIDDYMANSRSEW